MIIDVPGQKDFARGLAELVATARKARGYQAKVRLLKRMANVDLTSFRRPSDGEILPTFRGRRFKIDPVGVGTHTVSVISGIEDYRTILAHGIERVVRSFFTDRQVRDLVRDVVSGDEALQAAVRMASHRRESWDTGDGSPPADVSLLPIAPDGACGTRVDGPLPEAYLSDLASLAVFSSVMFGGCELPIGTYAVDDSRDDPGAPPDDIAGEGNFVPFTIRPRRDSFRFHQDAHPDEVLYNAWVGVTQRADMALVELVEHAIIDGRNNATTLRRGLALLAGAIGPWDGRAGEAGAVLIRRILGTLRSSPDTEIILGTFGHPRKMTTHALRTFLPDLRDHTLFRLSRERGLVRLVDEFGVETNNVERHVLEEQGKRYRLRPELDQTVRELLNSLPPEQKQLLLSMVFEERRIQR